MILLRVIKTLQSLPEYSKLSLFPQLRKVDLPLVAAREPRTLKVATESVQDVHDGRGGRTPASF